MKIRFLRDCRAPQAFEREYCSCCGPEREVEMTDFSKDEEADPNIYNHDIDLTGLKYREDYDIIEYP